MFESEDEWLDYDDILIIPNLSDIESRDEILLENEDGYIPIFSAPMKNISEYSFVLELGKLGGIGILHRFMPRKERYQTIGALTIPKIPFGNTVLAKVYSSRAASLTKSIICCLNSGVQSSGCSSLIVLIMLIPKFRMITTG